jgi:hypothetical protein
MLNYEFLIVGVREARTLIQRKKFIINPNGTYLSYETLSSRRTPRALPSGAGRDPECSMVRVFLDSGRRRNDGIIEICLK